MTAKIQPLNKKPTPTQIRLLFNAALRAGVIGGGAVSLLLLVNLIAFPLLRNILMPPAFVIVWIVTGIGAAMLAGNLVKTSQDGRRVGVLAGLISGVVGGLTSIILAAFGVSFTQIGAGVLTEFSQAQLAAMAESGITEQLLALAGSIVAALFVCGIGGMVVSALLGGLGGWLYPKFNK